MPGRHGPRTAARHLFLASLLFLSCAGKTADAPPPAAAPTPLRPVARLAFHWNDASDTTRILRAPGNQTLRTALTLSGVSDSLQGFTIHFRLEPTTNRKGTAWTLANNDSCLAAVWAGTIGRDPKAPAPWPNKLLITDARALPDGSMWMIVAATFDLVAMHPDSTYLVCNMTFTPPQPVSDKASCSGWDAPVRVYVENATVLYTTVEQPVFELDKPLFYEPTAVN